MAGMLMTPQQQMALMQQLVTQQQLLAKAGVVVGGGQAQGHSCVNIEYPFFASLFHALSSSLLSFD
jgi:hypothetical protein